MILVLNAGGNIGKALVEVLQSRSADFTAAYRSQEDVDAAEQSGLKAVVADYGQPETLRKAFTGVKKAFFVTPPTLNLEELEANVVAAAKEAGVRHLVKMSVWGAETGAFIFAQPHKASEENIVASGIAYTFLRPTGFMQNILGQAASIKGQGVFALPAGEARVAEIDYRDIARVAASALLEDGHEGKAYELSGPAAMTYAERAQVLSEALGKPVTYLAVSDADWKATMLGYGLPEWQVDGILDLQRYYKSGASDRVTEHVEQVTGSKPRTYAQFVTDYIAAFR